MSSTAYCNILLLYMCLCKVGVLRCARLLLSDRERVTNPTVRRKYAPHLLGF